MKQEGLPSLFNLLIFIFFFFSCEKVSCEDPFYEACKPIKCGDQNVRYPFWIEGKQDKSRGSPGFNLTCQRDQMLLATPGNELLVHGIFYNNQSLRVSHSSLSSLRNGCFPVISDLLLPWDGFEIASTENISDLFLLHSCTSLPANLSHYEIGCKNGPRGLIMFPEDRNLSRGMNRCEMKVKLPVELYGGEGTGDYLQMLKRGFLLKNKASDCKPCETSGGRYLCPGNNPKNRPLVLILATAAPGTAVLALALLVVKTKLGKRVLSILWNNKTEEQQKIEAFLKNYGSHFPKRYMYSEIKKITKSLRFKLGQRGYGCVFKGNLENGQPVAVKVIKGLEGKGEEFINEVAAISRTSHINIVTLLGFCFEGCNKAVVYEYMPNRSLNKFTYNRSSQIKHQLGWETLYKIAIGITRGLEYLHSGCIIRILHFDIKPRNILLNSNFCPKYLTLALQSFVHKKRVSYGMMILKIIGERENCFDESNSLNEKYFSDWIYKHLELDEKLEPRKLMTLRHTNSEER
ncbi:Glycerophosphodiester phosphodiesterase [Bertholletia excelsa]